MTASPVYSQTEYQRVITRLNTYQNAVVDKLQETGSTRPVQVVAAAGSGKTATLIAGIAKIAHDQKIGLCDVVVTTFTRKAMDELDARLKPVLPPGLRAQLRLGTWHGLAGRHLKYLSYPERPRHNWNPDRNLDIVGGKQGRDGLPRVDYVWGDIVGPSWRDLPWLSGVKGMGLLDDGTSVSPRDYALAADVLAGEGLCSFDKKAIQLAEERYPGLQIGSEGRRSNEPGNPRYNHGLLIEAWRRYDRVKAALNVWDFRDSMDHYWRYGRETAKLVLVDEAQDNSFNQLDCARRISERGRGRFFLIGDVRQSIFSWKGADPGFMLNLGETDDAELLEIPTNYRSGRHIVALGNAISEGQSWSMGSAAMAARTNAPGSERDVTLGRAILRVGHPYGGPESPVVDGYIRRPPMGDDALATADGVARDIQQLLAQGVPHKDIAILNRTNGANTAYEIACLKMGIPVLCVGSRISFFDRKEVADCMAWAALVCGAELSTGRDVVRAIARPAKGATESVGKKVREEGWEEMRGAEVLDHLIASPPGRGMGQVNNRKAAELVRTLIGELRGVWLQHGWSGLIPAITAMYLRQDEEFDKVEEGTEQESVTSDADAGVDLIQTWSTIANGFDGLASLRAFAARMAHEQIRYMGVDDMSAEDRARFEAERSSRVTISTIHRSKGLEWSYVFVELSAQAFPSARSAASEDRLAEEQRLFYVAVTRAANVLSVSCSALGATGKPAGPSQFMDVVDAYLHAHPEAEPKAEHEGTDEGAEEPQPQESKLEEFLRWVSEDTVLASCTSTAMTREGANGEKILDRLILGGEAGSKGFTVVAYPADNSESWWEIYINTPDTGYDVDGLAAWPAYSAELVDALHGAVALAYTAAMSQDVVRPVDPPLEVTPDLSVAHAVVEAASPDELRSATPTAPVQAEVLNPETGVLRYLIQGLRSGAFASVQSPTGWDWLSFADYLEGAGYEVAIGLLQQLLLSIPPVLGGDIARVQSSIEIPKPFIGSAGVKPKAYVVTGRDPITGKPTSQVAVPFERMITLLSGSFVVVRTEDGSSGNVSWDIQIVRPSNVLVPVSSCTFPQAEGPKHWESCWTGIPNTWDGDRLSQRLAGASPEIYKAARRLYEASGGEALIEMSSNMIGAQGLSIMPLTEFTRLLQDPAFSGVLDTTTQAKGFLYRWLI